MDETRSQKSLRGRKRVVGSNTVHLKVVSQPEPLQERDLRMAHSPGSITRVGAIHSLENLLEFLAYHRAYRVLWVNRDDEISLSDLHYAGLDLTKLTFVTAANAFLNLKNCLQTARHPLLIAPKNELTHTQLKELEPLLIAAHAELILID